MPTYEYACRECSEHLEVVQKFTDDPLTECPACKGRLRKVFGNIGISFRGSGFYKTDSRASDNGSDKAKDKEKDKDKEPAKAESPSSAGSDGGAKKADAPAKVDTGKGSSTAAAS